MYMYEWDKSVHNLLWFMIDLTITTLAFFNCGLNNSSMWAIIASYIYMCTCMFKCQCIILGIYLCHCGMYMCTMYVSPHVWYVSQMYIHRDDSLVRTDHWCRGRRVPGSSQTWSGSSVFGPSWAQTVSDNKTRRSLNSRNTMHYTMYM